MTSFIISSKTEERQVILAQNLCDERNIDQFDRTVISLVNETSLGIDMVKKLLQKVFLKPRNSEDKAVIITNASLLTLPAQNALLKLLEEPPEHTYLFLLVDSVDSLLPTILSRCQVIKDISSQSTLSQGEKQKIIQDYLLWTTQDIGSALKLAERMAKNKENLLSHLEKVLIAVDNLLQKEVGEGKEVKPQALRLQALQKTYRALQKTNTNPRLTLEHLFLNLRD